MQSLIYKSVQNGSSNTGLKAALKGTLDGGLNFGFEWTPLSFL